MDKNKSINKLSSSLSVFPEAKDTPFNLHYVTNKAQDTLRQTLPINGKYIILNDASKFPDSGIIKITSSTSNTLLSKNEVIFYGKKIGNQLHLLHRAYNHTAPNTWPVGSKVTCPLMAEMHNAIKDAVVQIQKKIGLSDNPGVDSINGILSYLETKWLSPKPVFRAYPRSGSLPLSVTFHNFSTGLGNKYLWDFGDGNTSTEKNPIHVYQNEGKFTVRLTMISEKTQGLAEKADYIETNNEQASYFFYVTPLQGKKNVNFEFVDQSAGDIVERHWFFDDGTDITIKDPNIHSVSHSYGKEGTYIPSLLIRLSDNKIKKIFLQNELEIL